MKSPLIEKLAKAFEDGRTLDGAFLVENNVTADDCIALTNQLAAILRGWIHAPKEIQYALLIAGVSWDNPPLVSATWDSAIDQRAKRMLNEYLDKLNAG